MNPGLVVESLEIHDILAVEGSIYCLYLPVLSAAQELLVLASHHQLLSS